MKEFQEEAGVKEFQEEAGEEPVKVGWTHDMLTKRADAL